jgi:hypothetical protein
VERSWKELDSGMGSDALLMGRVKGSSLYGQFFVIARKSRLIPVREDYNMHRGLNYLTSFFLTAALASPMAIAQQDDQRQRQDQTQQRDQRDQQENRNNRNTENQQRVYDRSHHDYHQWNDNEDRSYRQYLGENHKDYRDFQSTSRRQQTKYWNWRHSHPDQDHQDNRSDRH